MTKRLKDTEMARMFPAIVKDAVVADIRSDYAVAIATIEKDRARIAALEDALRLFVKKWDDPDEPPFGEVYTLAKALLESPDTASDALPEGKK